MAVSYVMVRLIVLDNEEAGRRLLRWVPRQRINLPFRLDT